MSKIKVFYSISKFIFIVKLRIKLILFEVLNVTLTALDYTEHFFRSMKYTIESLRMSNVKTMVINFYDERRIKRLIQLVLQMNVKSMLIL